MLSETRRLPHLLSHLIDSDGHTTARLDGFTLSSHFQPIYSVSHARVVGHEALLRASDSECRPMAPPDVFGACRNAVELALLDSLSRIVHMRNFVRQQPHAQWLFLNIHPAVFQRLAMRPDGGTRYLEEVSAALDLPGQGMVLEVLETVVPRAEVFARFARPWHAPRPTPTAGGRRGMGRTPRMRSRPRGP